MLHWLNLIWFLRFYLLNDLSFLVCCLSSLLFINILDLYIHLEFSFQKVSFIKIKWRCLFFYPRLVIYQFLDWVASILSIFIRHLRTLFKFLVIKKQHVAYYIMIVSLWTKIMLMEGVLMMCLVNVEILTYDSPRNDYTQRDVYDGHQEIVDVKEKQLKS